MGEGNDEFMFIFASNFLHAVKSYDTGPPGNTSPPKEGVLRIFIVLKSSSLRPALNQRTLDLMAITLTITPPRRLRGGLLCHQNRIYDSAT
jgi:hypothetical protein